MEQSSRGSNPRFRTNHINELRRFLVCRLVPAASLGVRKTASLTPLMLLLLRSLILRGGHPFPVRLQPLHVGLQARAAGLEVR